MSDMKILHSTLFFYEYKDKPMLVITTSKVEEIEFLSQWLEKAIEKGFSIVTHHRELEIGLTAEKLNLSLFDSKLGYDIIEKP